MDLLTDAEKEYFRNFELLFASPGWAQLMAEIREQVAPMPEAGFWRAKNFEELISARIRAEHLLTLLGYPDLIEQRKATLIGGRENAAIETEAGLRANV